MDKQRRKYDRTKIWPETEAHLEYGDDMAGSGSLVKMTGRVDNLSVSGMYILTEQKIPTGTVVSIAIDFEPGKNPPNVIQAIGSIVRTDANGIAIEFSEIDAQFLGECMLQKLKSK